MTDSFKLHSVYISSLRMKKAYQFFCGVELLLAVCVASSVPTGMFQTGCLERHFWLSVKSSFLSLRVRFYFEDQYGLHFLSDQEAARCGYTIKINDVRDLVFRASFLACHVYIKMGTDYHLSLRFVNLQTGENGTVYPLQLHCTIPRNNWSSREIVCEEKYMEVSVQKPDLSVVSKPENKAAADLSVMFHGASKVLSQREAAALGYYISLRGPRLTLRSFYSSPFSQFTKEKGVDLEIVRALILYKLQSNILAVDSTLACSLDVAAADGSNLLWTVPYIISPLVYGQFKDRGVRFRVNNQALSESQTKEQGFKIDLLDGRLEVRIPAGALRGHIKSGVLRGRYSMSMSVDLFFMSQWEDERWPLTQHRSFRLFRTPLIPQTLVFTNNTASSKELFSVTLGFFAADVSLQKVNVVGGGDLLIWSQSHHTQNDANLVVSRLTHSNGSYSYQLQFPLSHPKIIPKYIGGGFRMYSFTFTFTLSISPGEVVFHHQASLEHSVEYMAPLWPRLEGKCTDSSLLVLLHHGAQTKLQWELLLGESRLDWNLAEMCGFVVEAEDEYLTVEISLSSPWLNFEELALQGLVAKVEVSVVDAESLKVQDRLVHKCTFPARELLVCLPEGRVVAIVDTTHTSPPTSPNRTTLLDPSCVPMETDSSRALFSFTLNSCGTTVTTEGRFLVYENQISYNQDFLPFNDPIIHRDSPYRLTIQCYYPANDSRTHLIRPPVHPSPDPSPMMPIKRKSRGARNAAVWLSEENGG